MRQENLHQQYKQFYVSYLDEVEISVQTFYEN